MARYTHYYKVQPPSVKELPELIARLLAQYGLQITYKTEDYVMGQETTGQVPFNQLVKVEVLIHKSDMQGGVVKLTCVCKNGELQLQSSNHCQAVAARLDEAFQEYGAWRFVQKLNE